MRIGTKSILFGAHQFAIHPWFVALGWWKLYGFPWDPRLWVAFFVHDLGYIGKPNMDGLEGETHPILGAHLMEFFDIFSECSHGSDWRTFTLYHSRFLAKRDGARFSKLCVADKLAIALTPKWLYLILTNLTGEIHEYMQGKSARTPAGERSQWQWYGDVQKYCRAWAYEHRDCREDLWTGTKRELETNRRSVEMST